MEIHADQPAWKAQEARPPFVWHCETGEFCDPKTRWEQINDLGELFVAPPKRPGLTTALLASGTILASLVANGTLGPV
jgi:hypothetical protein